MILKKFITYFYTHSLPLLLPFDNNLIKSFVSCSWLWKTSENLTARCPMKWVKNPVWKEHGWKCTTAPPRAGWDEAMEPKAGKPQPQPPICTANDKGRFSFGLASGIWKKEVPFWNSKFSKGKANHLREIMRWKRQWAYTLVSSAGESACEDRAMPGMHLWIPGAWDMQAPVWLPMLTWAKLKSWRAVWALCRLGSERHCLQRRMSGGRALQGWLRKRGAIPALGSRGWPC